MKKISLFIILVLSFLLVSCNNQNTKQISQKNTNIEKQAEKLQITTSIIPLASITNYIGWDYVEAKSLVPAWVSPHGFDLKPSQMIQIQESYLILSLGYDHIDWFLDKALEDKNVLITTKWIEMIEWSDDHHHHEDEHHEDEHHDEENHEDKNHDEENHLEKNYKKHSETHDDDHHWEEHNENDYKDEHQDDHYENWHELDPHVWTSAENALLIAKNIESKLSEIQPQNSNYFSNNYESLEKELLWIKQSFLDRISWKTQSEFIVFHDAYSYLFSELNIDSSKKLVFRTNVLSDPNSLEMKEIIDEITKHWVKNFYKEPQFKDSNLDKLALDYSLEVDILNPFWSDDSKNWYINNYSNNLKALEKIYE